MAGEGSEDSWVVCDVATVAEVALWAVDAETADYDDVVADCG